MEDEEECGGHGWDVLAAYDPTGTFTDTCSGNTSQALVTITNASSSSSSSSSSSGGGGGGGGGSAWRCFVNSV